MSTNSDLAGWGEPQATDAEKALGNLLEKILAGIESGKGFEPAPVEGETPELVERGRVLLHTVGLLYGCVAGIWQTSGEGTSRIPLATGIGQLPEPLSEEFRVLQVLGEGTFGRVLLAEDLNLGWRVALKTLKLPATTTAGVQVLSALRTEARHLAQMEHPNIVRIHAWREARNEYFLVLQFVPGGSLAERLKMEKVLGWQEAARYTADVGDALIEAHKRGVIHRDVKPENILWDAVRNEAILTDFGVSARLAEAGTVAGTPTYMAPEAFEGEVSPALDVYGLAATLYRLATGELPFASTPVEELIRRKSLGLPIPDPCCRMIPEPLERVIRAGLAGRSEDRPGMAEFVATLRTALNHLLADNFVVPAPANLRLVVSRRVRGDHYEPVATTTPAPVGPMRDMTKVPTKPDQASVQTGEQVRIEVIADMTGYMTVFNIGPTGNLNLLYPDEPTAVPSHIGTDRPLHIVDVVMTPPVGRERVIAVWSKDPLPLRLGQLLSLAEESRAGVTRSYQSTRDMKRVQQTVAALPAGAWSTAVLELRHVSG